MGSQTIWLDAPDIKAQTWLLKDGTVITTPPLERTATNKRVRVKGTQTSMGIRQVDGLFSAAINKIATEHGSELWMRLIDDPEQERIAATRYIDARSDAVFGRPLELHLLRESDSGNRNRTTAMWQFKADGLPLYAYLFLELESGYNGRVALDTHLSFRGTHPNDSSFEADEANGYWGDYNSSGWNRVAQRMPYYGSESENINLFLADKEPFPGAEQASKNRNFGTQVRQAVATMAKRISEFEALETIELPDLRYPASPAMTTFRIVGTNVTGAFLQECQDFIQTAPIVERIKEHYEALQRDLRLLGVVMPKPVDDDNFARAADGDFAALDIDVTPSVLVNGESANDSQHSVYLNFATGTVTVACTAHGNADAMAQWEIDKFRLDATGDMSEFLAYARAFSRKHNEKQARALSEARTFDPEKLDD